jgi:glycosyltransferase involved in cell wall biosynthesis
VSNDIVARHRANGIIKLGEATTTIYNQPRLKEEPPVERVPSAEFTFGALGRVGDDKGTWKIIEAFRALAGGPGGERLRLTIAGPGTEYDLARLHAATADDPRIEYLGTSTPTEFYSRVDCALVPTQWAEPFGRTAAEALILGVPLLASAIGGLPEVVDAFGGRAHLVKDHMSASAWSIAMTIAMSGGLPERPAGTPILVQSVHGQYLMAYQSVIESQR